MTTTPITANLIGERLRALRTSKNLSLAKVEELSNGYWKAVRVSSYERADRGVTVTVLADLVAWYGGDILDVIDPDRTPAWAVDWTTLTTTLTAHLRDEATRLLTQAIPQTAPADTPGCATETTAR